MTKRIASYLLALAFSVSIYAQNINETSVTINGMPVHTACTVRLQKDLDLVQAAMRKQLSGLKTKKVDGYTAALEQTVTELALSPINLYTLVEEQGKRKDKAVVVTVAAVAISSSVDRMFWMSAFSTLIRTWA